MNSQSHFDYSAIFINRGISASKANELSQMILEACPWLDKNEELAESIVEGMLESELPAEVLTKISAKELVDWHNEKVRRSGHSFPADSYGEVYGLIGRYGKIELGDDADYFLLEDSFSTRDILVIALRGSVNQGLGEALHSWLKNQNDYASITVVNQCSDILIRHDR